MSHRLPIAALGLALALALSAPARAEAIVFTDSDHPVEAGVGVRVVELDAARRILAELSKGLPREQEAAAGVARKRLRSGDVISRLRAAYQGIADAYSLGVERLPAVVVDRRYVVYGEADVDAALALVAQYRERQ
jgi:integrating conjugative element protein (TIGR03757 family)